MRQRKAAEQAAEQEDEARGLAEAAKKAEAEAGAVPTTPTPSTQPTATRTDEVSSDAVNEEAAGTPALAARSSEDTTTTTTIPKGGNEDTRGTNGERTEAEGAGDAATTAGEKVGMEGAELSTMLEEAPEMTGGLGSEAAPGETKANHGDEAEKELEGRDGTGGEGKGKERAKEPSNLGVAAKLLPAAGPAVNKALPGMSEEGPEKDDTTAAPLGEVGLRGSSNVSACGMPSTSASGSGGGGGAGDSSLTRSSSDNPARAELARQRKDIAFLVDQAKEGIVYVNQAVDMADVLRGFVFTRHGIPVRDTAVGQELMREGRCTLRERFGILFLSRFVSRSIPSARLAPRAMGAWLLNWISSQERQLLLPTEASTTPVSTPPLCAERWCRAGHLS